MQTEKKYRILFIFNHVSKHLEMPLLNIFSKLIEIGHEVHVVYSLENKDNNFEVNLQKIPLIIAKNLLIANKLDVSWADVPFAIRRYIKKYEQFDVIHSFGLCCGVLSYPAGIASRAVIINTPNATVDILEQTIYGLIMRIITDNIYYVFNRLCDKIIFSSLADKINSTKRMIYNNITSDDIDFAANNSEITAQLLKIYTATEKSKIKTK